VVHRTAAAWWQPLDSTGSEPKAARKLRRRSLPKSGLPTELPEYVGWPTSGPSEDKALLKMRQAKLKGHVDWVCWTKETKDGLHGKARNASRKPGATCCSTSSWCTNYGYVGADGEVHWPAEPAVGSARRFISVAWRCAAASDATDVPRTRSCDNRTWAMTQEAKPRQAGVGSSAKATTLGAPAPVTPAAKAPCSSAASLRLGVGGASCSPQVPKALGLSSGIAPMAWAWAEAQPPAADWWKQPLGGGAGALGAKAEGFGGELTALQGLGGLISSDAALLDAQRSWALLRSAYLAGADAKLSSMLSDADCRAATASGSSEGRAAGAGPEVSIPFVDKSLDEAAWLVRSKLENLRHRTAEAAAVLSGSSWERQRRPALDAAAPAPLLESTPTPSPLLGAAEALSGAAATASPSAVMS